jgi:hypothetical protein
VFRCPLTKLRPQRPWPVRGARWLHSDRRFGDSQCSRVRGDSRHYAIYPPAAPLHLCSPPVHRLDTHAAQPETRWWSSGFGPSGRLRAAGSVISVALVRPQRTGHERPTIRTRDRDHPARRWSWPSARTSLRSRGRRLRTCPFHKRARPFLKNTTAPHRTGARLCAYDWVGPSRGSPAEPASGTGDAASTSSWTRSGGCAHA